VAEPSDLSTPGGVDYYRDTVYWEEFPEVAARLNERLTGDASRDWMELVRDHLGGAVVRHALVPNCGNGRIERELHRRGVLERATGVDIGEDLLRTARAEAARLQLPFEYRRADINDVAALAAPVGTYDAVVAVAALHHIRYIDRVFRHLAELLGGDGRFVTYDYVGAHRNQWPWPQWEAVVALNDELPEPYRQHLVYPHLPTMLVDDPTEAIHSELVVATWNRYFTADVDVRLGGALAYPLLTHNLALHRAPAAERATWVGHVLDADAAFAAAHPELDVTLVRIGRPRPEVLTDTDQLEAWTMEEEARASARPTSTAGGTDRSPRCSGSRSA
jgi:SAM-dependent methyltransferase